MLLEKCPTLARIFETRVTLGRDGAEHPIHSEIHLEFAERLFHVILEAKPKKVVEIGMAFGVSTLAILTALEQIGSESSLISIDPFQSTHWHGCGLINVEQARLGHRHRWVEKPDFLALPEMLAEGSLFDFAYIDGSHLFEYAFLDFWYLDRMLAVGGVLGFNDCAWRPVDKVIRFMSTHRAYDELPDTQTQARSWLFRLKKIYWELIRFRHWRDRFFRKTAVRELEDTFHVGF